MKTTRPCSGFGILLALLFVSALGKCLHEDKAILPRSSDGSGRSGGESTTKPGLAGYISQRGTSDEKAHQHALYSGGPPRMYRTLAQRSVGRYVLAGSSLFGECVRVYAPSPLSNIYTRLGSMLGQNQRTRSSELKSNSLQPGLSYERFMSQDDRSDKDDPVDEPLLTPPDKYHRVSHSFLVRHGIGHVENVSVQGDHLDPPSAPTTMASNTPSAMASETPVFPFKPLSSLRRKGRPVQDDLDLLSEVEEEEKEEEAVADWKLSLNRRIGRGNEGQATRPKKQVDRSTKKPQRGVGNAAPGQTGGRVDSAGVIGTEEISRNLVSTDDDSAIALVRKLRDAADGRNKGSV